MADSHAPESSSTPPSSSMPPLFAGLPPLPGLQLAETVKDSAQQIWLAGLGAFAKAHEEGGRVFESLVKDGINIQRQTQAAAEEHLAEATSKMNDMASGIAQQASSQWNKLESIFEDRVAKALNHLGMPSAQDVAALVARVEALERQLAEVSRSAPPAADTARSD